MKKIFLILFTVTVVFSFIHPVLADINEGLVAYYPFNGNADDESGNGNHGAVFGVTSIEDRFGNPNTAYYFNGKDNYIEIIPQTDVSAIGDFTISVWTYLFDWKDQPMDYTDRQYIFDGHSHSKTVYSDFYRQGFFLIYDGNPDTQEIHDGIYYDDSKMLEQNTKFELKGKWLHHVFLRRGDTDYTYINGQSIVSTYVTNRDIKSDELLDMQHSWFIGTFSGNNPNYHPGFNYSFYGLMDDVRFYNRALSESEIKELYGNYHCEGDFDHDGDVDGSDLAVFAADFGRTDCCEPDVPPCESDFDKDCDVDGSDLAIFAADFGRTDCPK